MEVKSCKFNESLKFQEYQDSEDFHLMQNSVRSIAGQVVFRQSRMLGIVDRDYKVRELSLPIELLIRIDCYFLGNEGNFHY